MAIENVTDKDIFTLLEKNKNVPVVVYAFGTSCAPCKAFAPLYQELSNELGYACVFLKVNVDDAPIFTRQYNIRSLPTSIVFKNNTLLDIKVGVSTKEDYKKFLLSNL